jgi:two-component system, LytTR family, response regulator
MRCIIIEDEPLAAERVKNYAQRIPALQVLHWFDSGSSALEYLQHHKVDLIFLDLHLGESSGITMLEKGLIEGKVIITTAYAEYALKGYDFDVVDYLLKPFVFDRFEKAVQKAMRKTEQSDGFIYVKSEYKQEKLYLSDVLYIEGMGDYRRIHTTKGRIMTLQTFKEFEATVAPSDLMRIHKSYMVNVRRIRSRTASTVTLDNGLQLPVGEKYKT